MNSLSQLIEAWSRKLDREAVMELSPIREGFENTSYTQENIPAQASVSLREIFNEQDRPNTNMDGSGLQAWTLTETDNALLVTNRIAFLDRLQDMPSAALLELERHLIKDDREFYGPPQVNYEALSGYCKATTAVQNGYWRGIRRNGWYRGIRLEQTSAAYALVTLWESFPQATRDKLVAELQPGKPTTLSLSHLSIRTQQRLVAALRDFGADSLYSHVCWNPDFTEYLRLCKLQVWPDRKGIVDGRANLRLEVIAPEVNGQPHVLISGQLRQVPVTLAQHHN
jgi:hypothetical protein